MARTSDILDATNPEIIYHYTSPTGLIGVLSDGQLWATDIRYLNDSSELLHAEGVHRRVLKELVAESPAGSLEKRLARAALKHRHSDSRLRAYVVCFCADDDLLTQWKTYGAWGSGFSIGFDRRALELALPSLGPSTSVDSFWTADHPEMSFKRIVYSEEAQREAFRLSFSRYVSRLPADPSVAEIDDMALDIVGDVARSASGFKHPAFEQEKEWRIVISSHQWDTPPEKLFFRASSRTVIPYRKTEEQPGKRLPIVSVTVGPTLNQELSMLSVIQLLGATGYYNDEERFVQIKRSNVPLTRTD